MSPFHKHGINKSSIYNKVLLCTVALHYAFFSNIQPQLSWLSVFSNCNYFPQQFQAKKIVPACQCQLVHRLFYLLEAFMAELQSSHLHPKHGCIGHIHEALLNSPTENSLLLKTESEETHSSCSPHQVSKAFNIVLKCA